MSSEAITHTSPPTDTDVAAALERNVTEWLQNRAVATGADRALLATRAVSVAQARCEVMVVVIDGERVLVAEADDHALDWSFGGRGRFLRSDLEQHLDHLKCMGWTAHGIVDDSRVRLTILKGARLDLMRWGVR